MIKLALYFGLDNFWSVNNIKFARMSLSSSEIFCNQHDTSFGKVFNTDSDSEQTVFMVKDLYRE